VNIKDKLPELYGIFRRKMHEVYRENHKPNPFADLMPSEFNAWQDYLRNSLSLEVVDADPNEEMEVFRSKDKKVWAKILNPSNGASYSHECILVPEDLAEKALVLDELPDRI
jgi:hypothetical protein